jgi:hypothetical protein
MKSMANPLGPVKIINEIYELKTLEDMKNPIALHMHTHPLVTVPAPVSTPEQKNMNVVEVGRPGTDADDAILCLCCMQCCMCCIW